MFGQGRDGGVFRQAALDRLSEILEQFVRCFVLPRCECKGDARLVKTQAVVDFLLPETTALIDGPLGFERTILPFLTEEPFETCFVGLRGGFHDRLDLARFIPECQADDQRNRFGLQPVGDAPCLATAADDRAQPKFLCHIQCAMNLVFRVCVKNDRNLSSQDAGDRLQVAIERNTPRVVWMTGGPSVQRLVPSGIQENLAKQRHRTHGRAGVSPPNVSFARRPDRSNDRRVLSEVRCKNLPPYRPVAELNDSAVSGQNGLRGRE